MGDRRRASLRAALAGSLLVWGAGDRLSSGYPLLTAGIASASATTLLSFAPTGSYAGGSSRRSHPRGDDGRWRDGWKWAQSERKGMI
jgi:hypothetical protein